MLAKKNLRFFGNLSVSATHDVKNALAIINETAGLLGDLASISEKGPAVPVARLHDISQRVIHQVRRADQVLKKLNRFSHSADQEMEIADLEATLHFILDLGSRLIERQGVIIQVIPPASPVRVDTCLFFLENMIWRAIEEACLASQTKQVMISLSPDASVPSIWFSMESAAEEKIKDLFASMEDKILISALNITIEKNKNCFGLLWPKHI